MSNHQASPWPAEPADLRSGVGDGGLTTAKHLTRPDAYIAAPVSFSVPMVNRIHAFTVTALGDQLDASCLDQITHALAGAGATIESITFLSERGPVVVALTVTVPVTDEPVRAHGHGLRHVLLATTTAGGASLDIAVVPAVVAAAGPRLLVADMDSTLIQIEVIDELARRHGVGDEVAEVTRRAMSGELDFEASLRARVTRLAGLDAAVLDELAAHLPVTDGAAALVRGVKRAGGHAAVVSGGFTFATAALVAQLGLDHGFANTLEIEAGRLTGRVIDPVVTPQRKAELVVELAAHHGLAPERVVAVGDGANDLLMLERAGLGVAFHAKPRLSAAADTALTSGGLERILYLLGSTSAEIDALMAPR